MQILYCNNNYRIKTDWNCIETSTLAQLFEQTWKEKMDEGVFRYKLKCLKSKFLEGCYQFFAQLNTDRFLNRRTPQLLHSLNQPFDEEAFNFTKLKEEEFMFHAEYNEIESKCVKSGNYVAVNVSPLDFGHSLILPSLYEKLPQILTMESIQFALLTLLSNHNPAFRIGFNSLCAFATVNHLHLHAYYLNQQMLLEIIEVVYLSGNCYTLEKHPSKGYVFQITAVEDILPITRDVYKLTKFLVENEIAHNMYMTRALCFERANRFVQTTERDCVRIYIWPRTNSAAMKILDEFNPALCELFGHLLIKNEESYNQLTENQIVEIITSITDGPFNATKEKVRQIFETTE